MGRRNHGMLAVVGAGVQTIRDERTRDDHRGGDRKALRFAVKALQIEGRGGGSVGLFSKAKAQLDGRVGNRAARHGRGLCQRLFEMKELWLLRDAVAMLVGAAAGAALSPVSTGAFWAIVAFYGVVSVLFDDET